MVASSPIWEARSLREVVTKLVDGSHNPPPKQDTGLPMLSARNIDRGQVLFDDYRLISESAFASENARTRIAPGDVLLTIVGTIGRTAVVPEGSQPFSLQRSVAVLTPSANLLPKFLCYQLESPAIQKHFEANARGTAQKGVYLKTLGQTPVVLPPVDLQREIVAELEKQFSRLDEAVANLQRVKANLKRYKASVLKAAVEGRLVETEATLAHRESRTYETGEQLLRAALIARRARWDRRGQYVEPKATASDELSSLPDGWVWANVEQLGFVRGGKRLPAGHKYAEEVTPHPYIRVTDFADYGINLDGLLYLKPETHKEIQRYTILSDDLYISIAGSIGLVGVLPERLSGANLTENAAKITGLEHVQKEYLMYWLSSASGIDFISDSTIATTQAKLALYRIERIPVPLPPLAEQARIIAEVDRHLSIIREVESEVDANLQRAQALRQSVLQRAFSTGSPNADDLQPPR